MFASGEDGIRIEDPNEVIIFDDKEWINKFIKVENKEESFKLFHDEEDKNYDDLYKEAYKSFSIENYNTALAHFIKLKSLKPEEIKFDIKIVECYFNISYYSKTIEKCDEILAKNLITSNENKNFSNILSLKIKSLINLKKLNEAKKVIEENKEFIDKNKTQFFLIKEEIKNKMKNLEGEYDFSEIYNMSKESFNVNLGEYINKKLELKFTNNLGISIYSKEKISRG
jgi:tetratricopeptide (TPR) repeat protein